VPKDWLLGQWYPRELTVNQQMSSDLNCSCMTMSSSSYITGFFWGEICCLCQSTDTKYTNYIWRLILIFFKSHKYLPPNWSKWNQTGLEWSFVDSFFKKICTAVFLVQDGRRNFFHWPLLLHFMSKWTQIVASWQ
jgi:hypothetical protein